MHRCRFQRIWLTCWIAHEAALADYRQANKMSPNYEEPKEALERLK